MYKHLYRVLTALTLFAVAMVPATQAQSIMLKASIPFDFVVGEKTLPSGEYQVKSVNQTSVAIQSIDSNSSAMVLTSATQAARIVDDGKLVFNRYGDQYFLAEVAGFERKTAHELARSKREDQIAKNADTARVMVQAKRK